MYENRTPTARLLAPAELAAIEQRARGMGGSYIHVPTVLALAQHDVPVLLAEVRRLQERVRELEGFGAVAAAA